MKEGVPADCAQQPTALPSNRSRRPEVSWSCDGFLATDMLCLLATVGYFQHVKHEQFCPLVGIEHRDDLKNSALEPDLHLRGDTGDEPDSNFVIRCRDKFTDRKTVAPG
jgi:hypothetical protein